MTSIEQQAEKEFPWPNPERFEVTGGELFKSEVRYTMASRAAYIKGANSRTLPVPWVKATSLNVPTGYSCYRVLNPQFSEKILKMYSAEQLPIVEGYYEFDKQGALEKLHNLERGCTLEWLDTSATLSTPQEVFEFAEGLKTSYADEELLRKVIALHKLIKTKTNEKVNQDSK